MTENFKHETLIPKRNFKSSIFEMIYNRDKKELLALYNALNGTTYDNPEELEVTTLENAVYLSMHNDVSFILDCRLMLYEHQSTYSPNLPLRFLHYISELYSKLTKDKNIYGTKPVMLPTPKFVIFYNGTDDFPDCMELRLSSLFIVKEEEPALELTAVMFNINKGHNRELMDSCKTLRDYAEYTDRIRRYAKEMELAEAVERAITECIKEGVLADFLERNRREAMAVSIYEYDYEKHIRQEREEHFQYGREEGLKEGRKEGHREGHKEGCKEGAMNFIRFCKKRGMKHQEILDGLQEEYHFSKDEACDILQEYGE